MKKNLFVLILVVSILILNLAFAKSTQDLNKTALPAIPIEELDTLPIEKTYTYEEMLELQKKNDIDAKSIEHFKGIHEENVKQIGHEYNLNSLVSSSHTVRYQKFSFNSKDVLRPGGLFVYRFTPQLWVGLLYNDNFPEPEKIVSLSDPYIYNTLRGGGINGGHFKYDLITGNEINIWVVGKVFDQTATKISSDISIGTGQTGKASLSVEKQTSYVADISHYDTYYSAALDR
ncbi:MAG: hypothetical protein GX053_12480 [Tissierella sp.]|nr:hypothetical protein [Tissierella sp.]